MQKKLISTVFGVLMPIWYNWWNCLWSVGQHDLKSNFCFVPKTLFDFCEIILFCHGWILPTNFEFTSIMIMVSCVIHGDTYIWGGCMSLWQMSYLWNKNVALQLWKYLYTLLYAHSVMVLCFNWQPTGHSLIWFSSFPVSRNSLIIRTM